MALSNIYAKLKTAMGHNGALEFVPIRTTTGRERLREFCNAGRPVHYFVDREDRASFAFAIDPGRLPVSANVKYTENKQALAIGDYGRYCAHAVDK